MAIACMNPVTTPKSEPYWTARPIFENRSAGGSIASSIKGATTSSSITGATTASSITGATTASSTTGATTASSTTGAGATSVGVPPDQLDRTAFTSVPFASALAALT